MKQSTKTCLGSYLLLSCVAFIVLFFSACTNHYMTKDMLLRQFKPKHEDGNYSVRVMRLPTAAGYLVFEYDSNNVGKLLCFNEKGDRVYLSVNQNTQLVIKDVKGEIYKFYLDTVFIKNDVLHGLRSRILSRELSLNINDIDKIEVYTELSKETSAEKGEEKKL